MLIILILSCLAAYCMGSISSAVLVCRFMGLPDPRSQGSKNPGATNVLRLGGRKAAIITLLGDALKGFIPVLVAKLYHIEPEWMNLIMFSVFLGHLYPLFFGFQGGKGVATAVGVLLALSFPVGLLAIATWGITVYLARISSLAALLSAILAPLYALVLLGAVSALGVALMALLLIWRHRSNIQRLWQGTEPKLGTFKK
jgi:glycerol-3-phosphate acyltransferase PlsY